MIEIPQPTNVFRYFLDITQIPHGSGNTKAISDYCAKFAENKGLWYKQDKYNNIIIKKPASKGYEKYAPIIIQGHLDMVCEKESNITINFETDPLNIKTDGIFIYADGTTLGGDDGIAAAYALALLDSENIEHPPLEVVLTSDEETGMDGAIGLDTSCLKGKMLLNIDSEQEGIFTVSCAGGIAVHLNLPVTFEETTADYIKITIDGLLGGHSGIEIHKGHANAGIIASKLLYILCKKHNARLSSINGGLKHNAIPSECSIIISADFNNSLLSEIKAFEKEMQEKFSETDPNLKITAEFLAEKTLPLTTAEKSRLLAGVLSSIPDGVVSMSSDIEGLVKTSSNLGIIETNENGIYMLSSVRSSDEADIYSLSERISHHIIKAGGTAEKKDAYPAWEYMPESKLRTIMCTVYEKMFNISPSTEAIHAGLECGIFCGKIKGLECVSIGPDMFDIHTPKERLSIESVQRTWEFIKETLKNLKIQH